MKTKNIFIVGAVISVLIIIYYSFQSSQTDSSYVAKIEKERLEKNHYMRTGSDSPFSGKKDDFTELKYFPVDARYRINARLTPIENKKAIALPTNSNELKSYLEYGYAEFELDGVKNKLLILEIMESGPNNGTLFLAFSDDTSANETYGGGRYLEIKKVPGSTSITIDFNEAYNPYCAYNDSYSCPLPPPENLLKVAIRAGEMSYHK